jgi:hypothetical protein
MPPNPKLRKQSTLPDIFAPEPKESPDILLTTFLRSTEIISNPGGQPPQQALREILNDPRWTRRTLEDWFKKGPISNQLTLTSDPEFRAIYLVLLAKLEDDGREATGLGKSTSGDVQQKGPETKEEKEVYQKEQNRRIEEWKREQGIN